MPPNVRPDDKFSAIVTKEDEPARKQIDDYPTELVWCIKFLG